MYNKDTYNKIIHSKFNRNIIRITQKLNNIKEQLKTYHNTVCHVCTILIYVKSILPLMYDNNNDKIIIVNIISNISIAHVISENNIAV